MARSPDHFSRRLIMSRNNAFTVAARSSGHRRSIVPVLMALFVSILLAGPDASPARAGWKDLLDFSWNDSEPPEEEPVEIEAGTRLDTLYVGEYITAFGGTSVIEVRGVGLVNGLDGTGADPPPSFYRTSLVDEMRRQDVENPNQFLAMPSTAMVLVKGYIPVNAEKGEVFDIRVTLPPNSAATSLAGGTLFPTRLAEERIINGRRLQGDVLAVAAGPILTSGLADGRAGSSASRRGKILGGGSSRTDRNLAIALRSEYSSGRNSRRVATAIGQRFHGHDDAGIAIPMAEAKTDELIVLRVPDEYRHNYPRYINVIENIALNETAISRRVRLQTLEQQINMAGKSHLASLRLEAIGAAAVPTLKRALLNDNVEVRFNAAMALTYLGKTDGLEALAQAAKTEPAFRIYAFAALASCQHSQASIALADLLSDPVDETRYGAFRALTEINPRDPLVRATPIHADYHLHILGTSGPPLVHLTNHTKAEVVLFGSDQPLLLPATLRAGPDIQVVGDSGSNEVTISRFSGKHRGTLTVSPTLKNVLIACDQLGAKYPDIVSLLVQADRQHNLPGELAVDALPQAGREYAPEGKEGVPRTIGSKYTAPNLYAPPRAEAVDAQREAMTKPADDEIGASMIQQVSAEVPAEEPATKNKTNEKNRAGKATVAGNPPAAGTEPSKSQEPFWFDPRGWFDESESAPTRTGPPVQSEPE